MVSGTNEDSEVSNYTYNGLGVRVGTEVIVKDNTHGYTDFHCQTPTVLTGIDKPEVVLSDYVIDYTRLNIDQRVLVESETDGYDFRYTYGLDLVNVKVTGEDTSWWAQSVKKCVYSDYVHTDRLGSVVKPGGGGGGWRRRLATTPKSCFLSEPLSGMLGSGLGETKSK